MPGAGGRKSLQHHRLDPVPQPPRRHSLAASVAWWVAWTSLLMVSLLILLGAVG